VETPFWSGNHYELNMSFGMLRDIQWVRLLDALWSYDLIHGPLAGRFVPDYPYPAQVNIQYPAPTATFTQHGILLLNDCELGLDVLVTRSLFECVSLSVPEGMFANCRDRHKVSPVSHSALQVAYQMLALYLYQAMPFEIASIGWDRDCQLRSELISDDGLRKAFLETGNFLVQEPVLRQFGVNVEDYEELLPGVRWGPDKSRT
jgi:hypothetical protein